MPDPMIDSSRRLLVVAASIAASLGAWGGAADARASVNTQAPAFRWLQPQPTPPGWKLARLPSGTATFAYPRTWRPIRTDPGTASVALLGHGRSIRGYLNLTPHQGAETLANWPSFRIEHLGDEGSTDVRLIAERARPRVSLGPWHVRDRQLSHVASPLPGDRMSGRGHSHQFRHRGRSPVEDLGAASGTIERAIASLRTD